MKLNLESPIFQFLGTLTDFVLLNLIFILTCLPIITIGPSLCALYSMCMKEVRNEQGYLVRCYLGYFKENFKTSFILSLFYYVIGTLLLFNLVFWLQLVSMIGQVIVVILLLCSLLFLSSLCYGFALNARFENSIPRTIKNSILLPLVHPKQTLLLLLILLAAGILLFFSGNFRIFLMFFGFAFVGYCQAFPLSNVFKQYE